MDIDEYDIVISRKTDKGLLMIDHALVNATDLLNAINNYRALFDSNNWEPSDEAGE